MTPAGGTIAALASAPGHADRAIIRIAGDLGTIAPRIDPLPGTRAAAAATIDLGSARLPCLAIRYTAPASYTGEDALELLVPGSPIVADRVLRTLLACEGVRPAEPGEFSARAYAAGKLTLDRAHGVQATIAAANSHQLRDAQRLLDGSFGRAARARSDDLARTLAKVEAGIDFADQDDVTAIEPAELLSELDRLRAAMDDELGSVRGGSRPTGVPRIALVGPPSAGKSTLFNALLGRQRAVTRPEPGTTRDALVEPWEPAPGVGVELIDLPGLDDADAATQAAARAEAETADVRLLCDEHGRFSPASEPAVRIRTKADRPCPGAPADAIGVCALTGRGLDTLREAVLAAIGLAGEASGLPVAVAAAMRRASDAIGRAVRIAAAEDAPAELVAGELREALDHLGAVTGRVDPDTVLGLVFSSFCVGK